MGAKSQREADKDIVIELSGLLHRLGKGESITDDDRAAISSVIRSARDVLLYPSSDPRIRSIETWLLVLFETSLSREIQGVNSDALPVYRTTILDPAFHMALYRLHRLHEEGVEQRKARAQYANTTDED